MRVFAGVFVTETNTFSPIPTGIGSFKREGNYYPAGTHPPEPTLFGSPIVVARQRARDRGWALTEGIATFAQPGGITTRAAHEELRNELLEGLRAALPVDLVILGLHGAMVAEGCEDCEGALLADVRALVGPDAVIGAVIDPHCHLTPEMVAHADLIIAFKEYPHTDIHERTEEMVDLAAQIAEGRVKPTSALIDLEMISLVFTTAGAGLQVLEWMRDYEMRPGVLSVSLGQGFPWADIPQMGSKVLVYTDSDPALAQDIARDFADRVIAVRDQLQEARPDIDGALDLALAASKGPIVIGEGADNAGGGAASDSTFFLRRMIARDIRDAALGPIWDPIAVSFAFEAGEGALIPLRIGGKVGPGSGDPVDAEVRVLALRRDMMMTGLGGTPCQLGDCARVAVGGIEVVLTSDRHQAMDTDLFTGLGCDLAAKRLIVVKSTQHFYASFAKIAAEVIYASSPGTVTLDLHSLPYRRISRPKWPLRD